MRAQAQEVVVEAGDVWRVELHGETAHRQTFDSLDNIRSNVPTITATKKTISAIMEESRKRIGFRTEL